MWRHRYGHADRFGRRAGGKHQPWTRHVHQYPTTLEQFSRVTVIWAAAALGATLGDILPGESNGQDLVELVGELGDGSGPDTSSDDTK